MSLNTQILIAAIFGVIFGFILNLFPETVFLDMSFVWNRGGQQYFYWSIKNALDSPYF